MNRLFVGYIDDFVIVYLDDILVFSKTPEEHEVHLQKVLEILQENKLYANPKKCSFFQTKIEYLGHVVENGTVSMS